MFEYIKSLFKSDQTREYEAWIKLSVYFTESALNDTEHYCICGLLNNNSAVLKSEVYTSMRIRLERCLEYHGKLGSYLWERDRFGSLRRARLCLKFAYLTLKGE